MDSSGHQDKWNAPSRGWPTFDENGKIIREDEDRESDPRERDQ